MSYSKSKGRSGKSAPFVMLPNHVIDSPNYLAMSHRAKTLLVDVLRSYNRSNNGDLAITMKLMKPRGWTSNDQIRKGIIELEHYGFIKLTRQGGRHKCNLYAVTFYKIDDCKGKHDLSPTTTPSNEWKVNQLGKPEFRYSVHRRAVQCTPQHGAISKLKIVN